LKNYES